MDKKELRKRLTAEAWKVTQEGETEAPFSGQYVDNKEKGVYKCVVCEQNLFSSEAKFDSKTGWPSFTEPENLERVRLGKDDSGGMKRTEVLCRKCGAHLGHVFSDTPAGRQRYCINSCSLEFQKKRSVKSNL
ncbi:peptide-methionine (R)-S-oxide reductase [Candidatus Campbellbacteria bacterium CG11_big_fil_rev_8_21_14_0_20_44_21]|uniref:peptide-methionine (R)-S-oxide reductase n=1 Tax=Candidatus Campbellbacteria bacterium CG22_combo_CG10-13_8_21_14_all_43_18 TaxID=1974530 RepID=A0A2H0DWV8_9BACT|nr:MAG: peptide-methionine (R)-S-oxide reductase [Candidatus Campbellbacteria bacterium CG22_combo_CG10-13_8_21_14_all_43_18]PIR24483.1 MAG: peptide-methionine (R)-S-oxide reductase [Candidatus Campbellbacteria bacterium CG11_big_fil_rev_8_21_14_0_20_44_21]